MKRSNKQLRMQHMRYRSPAGQRRPPQGIRFETDCGERIRILRERKGMTAKELAWQLGISPSTQSRIENGQDTRMPCELLLKYADTFHVSLDYLVGKTDIEGLPATVVTLGLTKKAVRNILHRKTDVEMLNRLLEHGEFCALTRRMFFYLSGQPAAGLKARNESLRIAEEAVLAGIRASCPEEKQKGIRDLEREAESMLIDPDEFNTAILTEHFRRLLTALREDISSGTALSNRFTADDSAAFLHSAFEPFGKNEPVDPRKQFETMLHMLLGDPLFAAMSGETKEEVERVILKAAAELSGEDMQCGNGKETAPAQI